VLGWLLCVRVLNRMLAGSFTLRFLSVRVLGRSLVRLIWGVVLVALALLLVCPWVVMMVVGRHVCGACDLPECVLRGLLGLSSEAAVVETRIREAE
jgi:hypothetical protein